MWSNRVKLASVDGKKYPNTFMDALKVFRELAAEYPDVKTELTYSGPFQLLVAVVLSAQCTDSQVNKATPALFERFPDARSLATGKPSEIEKLIHSCGFFRMKARALKSLSQDLINRFGGVVPKTLDELTSLRGVGRKTASVVLNQAFGLPAIAVDTHVSRVSQRLGWAQSKTPEKIEFELRKLFPENTWSALNGTLILHGRRVCKARKPLCDECSVRKQCLFFNNLR